jgi:mannose-6-phosphate isomerase-like protein (cupin superfamily)
MQITELVTAPRVPFDIDGKILYSGSRNEIIHLSLSPGEKIPLHDNPVDVIFYILEGSAVLMLESKEVILNRDSCLLLEKGILRGWHNRSDIYTRLLVIKQT